VGVQLGETVLEHTVSLGAEGSLERVMRAARPCWTLSAGRNEVSPPQLSLDEPLSPELALVCPELAERARAALPEPGWLAPVIRIVPRAATPRTRPAQALLLALVAIVMTVTPLALLVLGTSPALR
jgi:hypothetical protein